MSLTYSDFSEIVANLDRNKTVIQENLDVPTLKAVKKRSVSGGHVAIQVQEAMTSVGQSTGAAVRTASAGSDITRMTVPPITHDAQLTVAFDLARTLNGHDQSVDVISSQYEVALGSMMAVQNASIIHDGYVQVDANDTAVAGVATVGVSDFGPFRVGQQLEADIDGAGTTFVAVRVLSITEDASGFGGDLQIEVLASDGSRNTSSTQAFGLGTILSWAGARSSSTKFESLERASGSGLMYGAAANPPGYLGRTVDQGGGLTLAAMRKLHGQLGRASGKRPNVVVMSEFQFEKLENLSLTESGSTAGGARRFTAKDKLDPYGDNWQGPMFAGAKVIVDASCPSDAVFMFHDSAIELLEWKSAGAEDVNGGGKAEISQTNNAYLVNLLSLSNLGVSTRSCVGKIDGLTY